MKRTYLSDMKKFIKKTYGSNVRMAKELGISPQTVTNWISSNPRGMLRHAPEIVANTNTTYHKLAMEVLYHEEYLRS